MHYIYKLFKKIATRRSPCIEIKMDNKEEARIAFIHCVLSQITYDEKTSVFEIPYGFCKNTPLKIF